MQLINSVRVYFAYVRALPGFPGQVSVFPGQRSENHFILWLHCVQIMVSIITLTVSPWQPFGREKECMRLALEAGVVDTPCPTALGGAGLPTQRRLENVIELCV